MAVKVVVETMPPLLMAGIRSVTAGALLFAWARIRGLPAPGPLLWRYGIVAGALMFLGGHGALFWASQHMASGLAAVLESTIPVWVAVVEGLRPSGARPTGRTILGLLAGLVGVAWLNLPGMHAEIDPWASLVLLSGAVAWSLATVWYRGERRPDSTMLAAALPLVSGGALLLAASALTGEPARVRAWDMTPTTLWALTYLIVFGSVVAFSAYSWLLNVASPTAIASYAYVNPMVAIALGWSLLGEEVTLSMLVAIGMTLTGVLLITTRRPTHPPGVSHVARRGPAAKSLGVLGSGHVTKPGETQ